MTKRAMLLAAIVSIPASAFAQEWAYFPPASVPTTKPADLIGLQYEKQLAALREEGLISSVQMAAR